MEIIIISFLLLLSLFFIVNLLTEGEESIIARAYFRFFRKKEGGGQVPQQIDTSIDTSKWKQGDVCTDRTGTYFFLLIAIDKEKAIITEISSNGAWEIKHGRKKPSIPNLKECALCSISDLRNQSLKEREEQAKKEAIYKAFKQRQEILLLIEEETTKLNQEDYDHN